MIKKSKHSMNKATLKALRGKSSRERLLHRLHCVAMALNGSSASEAARIYGDSPRAVAYWVTQFKQCGIDGLEENSRPGRPSTLDAEQLNVLQRFIKTSQNKGKTINASELENFIFREFKVSVNPHLSWRILKKLRA